MWPSGETPMPLVPRSPVAMATGGDSAAGAATRVTPKLCE